MSDEKNNMLFFPSSFFFFRLIDYFHWNLNVKKIQGCCTDDSWEQNKKHNIANSKIFPFPFQQAHNDISLFQELLYQMRLEEESGL